MFSQNFVAFSEYMNFKPKFSGFEILKSFKFYYTILFELVRKV